MKPLFHRATLKKTPSQMNVSFFVNQSAAFYVAWSVKPLNGSDMFDKIDF